MGRLSEILARWRQHREEEDWRRRRGRFAGLEADRPDRKQVMPRREPPEAEQVHRGQRYRDGGASDGT